MIRNAAYRLSAAATPMITWLSSPRKVGIIMLHGVYDELAEGDLPPPRSSVSARSFETNVLSLARAYNFISMDEAVEILNGARTTSKPCLALTFDDSLKCHVEVTAPRLVKWGIPGAFYISTKVINEQRSYWWVRLECALANSSGQTLSLNLPNGENLQVNTSEREKARQKLSSTIRSVATPTKCDEIVDQIEAQIGNGANGVRRRSSQGEIMTWDEARRLAKMGMTLGGHTVNHANLTLLDDDALNFEFTACREAIEKNTGQSCAHFCYPHGFHSENVRNVAEKLGFRSGVTIDAGWNSAGDSLFNLKRFAMPARDYELPWKLSGLPAAIGHLRQRQEPAHAMGA